MMRYMVLKMDTGIVPPAHVMLLASEFSREHDVCGIITATHSKRHLICGNHTVTIMIERVIRDDAT